MNESNEISSEVKKLTNEAQSLKLFSFEIPNCLYFSSLFIYGFSNISLTIRESAYLNPKTDENTSFDKSNQHIIQQARLRPDMIFKFASIFNEEVSQDIKPKDFFYLYDRNPNIISNWIKISRAIFSKPITKFYCLDNHLNDDEFISKKLHKMSIGDNVIFYSENILSTNIPLFAYPARSEDSDHSFFYSLRMAIGMQNGILCLRLNSAQKSIHFCHGNLTEDDLLDSLNEFHPFFLFYALQYKKEKLCKYTHNTYPGRHVPSTLKFGYDNDISVKFILDYEKELKKKKAYEYHKYLIECLIFPAAFIAGTDYSYEKYAHYLTVFFNNETSSMENFLSRSEDKEFNGNCRNLFAYYQRFLSFLRYHCSLIECFIEKNSQKFIEATKMAITLIPSCNPLITSPFIDLIKILAIKIDVTRKEKTVVETAINQFLSYIIDDGKGTNVSYNSAFDFKRDFDSSPEITIHQAYKEITYCFDELTKLYPNILDKIQKITFDNRDKSKDYKIYKKFIEKSISCTTRSNNIVI